MEEKCGDLEDLQIFRPKYPEENRGGYFFFALLLRTSWNDFMCGWGIMETLGVIHFFGARLELRPNGQTHE